MIKYIYDDLSRLTIASSTKADNNQNYRQTYSYNAIGNILNKSDIGNYLYNGNQGTNYANPHAATSINGVNSTYDNNGNLITNGALSNTWNYNNLLLSSNKGTSTINYSYDQNNNRITYLANGVTTITPNKYYEIKGSDITKYIYAGNELAATLNTTSDDSNIYYNHNDSLSGSNVISNASSTIEEVIDYYPFGGIRLDKQQGGFNEKKKFTGHTYDTDTDLNYMNARYQSGDTGIFLSEDSLSANIGINANKFKNKYNKDIIEVISNPQDLNSYSYVKNNPLKYVDPKGESRLYAWLLNPVSTIKQTIFWSGVSSAYLQELKGWNNSASFLKHSLELNPGTLNINKSNDSNKIIGQIEESSAYQKMVNTTIKEADSKNLTTAKIDNKLITFDNGDLFGALHDATINSNAYKSNGHWIFDNTITDKYDFDYGWKYNNYTGQTGANMATFSQDHGILSNYTVNIRFNYSR